MAVQGTSGIAAAAAGAGALLVWSGMRGTSVTGALRELLAGRQPSGVNQYPVIGNPASSSVLGSAAAPGSAASGSAISADAVRYAGHPYLYGGAPGPNGAAPWDCSSFVNWVLGHDLGMTLPGMSSPGYNGATHGPTTLSYLAWSRAVTVGHDPAGAQAGDLCVWPTHMGIATGGSQMISALNPSLGTAVTSIAAGGPFGEPLSVRRIAAGVPSVNTAGAQPGKTTVGGG